MSFHFWVNGWGFKADLEGSDLRMRWSLFLFSFFWEARAKQMFRGLAPPNFGRTKIGSSLKDVPDG